MSEKGLTLKTLTLNANLHSNMNSHIKLQEHHSNGLGGVAI